MRSTEFYRITVGGNLGSQWKAWFDGFAIGQGTLGNTVISGRLADQAALHGVLAKIRDLGLTLIAVQRVEGDETSDR